MMKQTLIFGLTLIAGFTSASTIEPTWESMAANHRVPEWFQNGKNSVVHVHPNSAGRIKQSDEQLCQQFPQVSRQPAGLWKQAMTGVVRTLAFGFGKRQNAGDGTSAGTQYPAGNQIDENASGWFGKYGRKTQDYGIPC